MQRMWENFVYTKARLMDSSHQSKDVSNYVILDMLNGIVLGVDINVTITNVFYIWHKILIF